MNNTITGQQAQEEMIKGIKVATQAIRPTYGHNGINAVIEDIRPPFHQVANDAQTIIQAIQVKDPIQNQGLSFLKELSDKQNSMSGDGRKTTCIIAETILDEGFKSELKGLNLKRELDKLISVIESKVDERTQEITIEDIHKVATIAGESEDIGNLISDIYKVIGKDGVITVEGSGSYTDTVRHIDGVRFSDTGYLANAFINDEEARRLGLPEKYAIYENPVILVTKQKIERQNQIDPLIMKLMGTEYNRKELIIFTHDMDLSVVDYLIKGHKNNPFKILIIKAPTIFRNEVFEDFARVTGATIVEPSNGIYLEKLPMTCLGTCDKIIVDKSETLLMGTANVDQHIEELKSNNDELSNLRIKWLKTKTAILKLGANNESELSYKRLKCEDAVNASRLALNGGVVAGGGITLYNIASELPNTVAGQILAKALQAPLFQIMANSGYKDIPVFPENVLDASIVLKNAIRNSISLTSTILTTGIVITLPREDKELKL